jgi:amino acid transporter
MSSATTAQTDAALATGAPEQKPGLRRELTLFGAVAVSVGLMGPTMAMNLNLALPAGLVGSAVPLVVLLAVVGVGLVSYSFIRLTQRFNHAGSVYAFAGATLGPRAGFFSGWALLATYIAFTCVTIPAVGIFGEAFLKGSGIWPGAGWMPVSAVATIVLVALTLREVRLVTRSLLTIEGISVALVALLSIVVLADVIGGGGPQDQSFTLSVFTVGDGVPFSSVALAVVFGFLSFAGFEAAATLGEETRNPRRDIPRAIGGTVVMAGIFYLLCSFTQAVGFGTSAEGVKAYAGSSSLFGDLGGTYVGAWMADLINLAAMLSAFGSALGCVTAGSRLLFAMGRDGFGSRRLERISRQGAPTTALLVIVGCAVLIIGGLRLFATKSSLDIFFWTATLGTLPLLVAYLMTTAGAIRLLFMREHVVRRWEIAIPLAALAFLVYVLWKNLYPVPDHPYNLFPYIVGGWLLVGLAIVLLVPGLAQAIGASLARSDGIDLDLAAQGQRLP